MVAYGDRVWTAQVRDVPDTLTILRAYAELKQLSNAELVRARQRDELREQRARDRRRERATQVGSYA